MRRALICLTLIIVLTMIGGRAKAVTFGNDGVELQTVLDNITLGPNAGISSTNVNTDGIPDCDDSSWTIYGLGLPFITVIIELTQWTGCNLLGIYDAANPMNKVQILGREAATGYSAVLSILADGSVVVNSVDTGIDFAGNTFGFYLDSRAGHPGWTGGLWYSDTALNVDHQDHMAAYQGKNIDTVEIPTLPMNIWNDREYILAFEDLHGMHWGNQNGINDGYPEWSDAEPDFDDLVVIIDSLRPALVPFEMSLPEGWSMISLPIKPYISKLSELFPDAVTVYGFKTGTGYVQVTKEEELEVGNGYWILLNEARSYTLKGQPIYEYTRPIDEDGWYMVGGCISPAQASMPNGKIYYIYEYIHERGYQRVPKSSNLEPGKGYWILFKQIAGEEELIVELTSP